MLSTHAGRLERWLGPEQLDKLVTSMRDWYGPPIALADVPGAVWAMKGGDFRGPIGAGQLSSMKDYATNRFTRALRRTTFRQLSTCNMGFASLSDLIYEATTSGKSQMLHYSKTLTTQVLGGASSAWAVGAFPQAGGNGSAAPGGRACTSATTGAFTFSNAASGDTLHFVSAFATNTAAGQCLLYDRIFDVAKTMSSTGTEAVTGAPTRYQSQTATAADYIGGNFLFPEVTVALGSGAHNWTSCTYTDQAAAASTLPSLAGVSAQIVNALDMGTGLWFAPLAAGDVGVKAITQLQCDASITGTVNFVIGHPIAWLLCPIALVMSVQDGINSVFQMTRIFDSACLALLNVTPPATTAPVLTGTLNVVSG